MSAGHYNVLLAAYARLDDLVVTADAPLFLAFQAARDRLLQACGLPATGHNIERLYDCIDHGLAPAVWLADVDRPLPRFVRSDEALFLAALASVFASRGVIERSARARDTAAFMNVGQDALTLAIIDHWLAGQICLATLHSRLGGESAMEAA